jgi:hypothetical protein
MAVETLAAAADMARCRQWGHEVDLGPVTEYYNHRQQQAAANAQALAEIEPGNDHLEERLIEAKRRRHWPPPETEPARATPGTHCADSACNFFISTRGAWRYHRRVFHSADSQEDVRNRVNRGQNGWCAYEKVKQPAQVTDDDATVAVAVLDDTLVAANDDERRPGRLFRNIGAARAFANDIGLGWEEFRRRIDDLGNTKYLFVRVRAQAPAAA